MDIIYPANTTEKVPAVLSFSYSNSSASVLNRNQRLNLVNTLSGFNDSFLEGAPANGIAWAIADHPKYCPWTNGKPVGGATDLYKSYEVNPDAAQKVKSAIRTLRTLGAGMNLSGKIGVYGFSRGSDAGSMSVGDRYVPEFEQAGFFQGTEDNVQAAALGSGVFDFKQIFNATGDGDANLETKCPLAWGPLASNAARWDSMGSAFLAKTAASAPVLFFYNTDDALYYQDQIKHFKAKLDSLGVSTDSLINYATGHAVPQTAAPLTKVYAFFKTYLTPPSVATGLMVNGLRPFKLRLSPNPAIDRMQLTFFTTKEGRLQIALYNAMFEAGITGFIPQFGHLPYVMGEGNKKLSKRDPESNLFHHRDRGFIPEGLLNYLALLGWGLSADQDIFTLDELAAAFDVANVNPNPARFDLKKAEAINAAHIRKLSASDFKARLLPYLQSAGIVGASLSAEEDAILEAAAPLIQERLQVLSEAPDLVEFLFKTADQIVVAEDALAGMPENVVEVLDAAVAALAKIDAENFKTEPVQAALQQALIEELGLKPRLAFGPLRTGISGRRISPPLFESMEILGKAETIARLEAFARSR
jgi:dienelactone hydrolase